MSVKLYTLHHDEEGPRALRHVDCAWVDFPGGETHVTVPPTVGSCTAALIDVRAGNFADIARMLVLTDALRRADVRDIHLLIPYVPGARQDRVAPGSGNPLTIKVYADLINSQFYNTVFVADPHSDVTPALINNCVVLSAADTLLDSFVGHDLAGLICPDAGAEKRTYELARALKCATVVHARKHRDTATGKLTGFQVEPLPKPGTYLIADDICDGGGTFLGIAEEISRSSASTGSTFWLYVTHGIFSKGTAELSRRFKWIGCSDSFPSEKSGVKVFDLLHIFNDEITERMFSC